MPTATMVNGNRVMFVLQNNNASQRDIVIDYGESVQTYGYSAAGALGDITLQPNNGERVIFIAEFMHFGTGAPLAFLTPPLED